MTYLDKLNETINLWSQKTISDEWLFAEFIEDVVDVMSPEEAFSHIDETIEVLLANNNESTIIQIIETILSLAGRSDTTEVPSKLKECHEILVKKMEQFDEYTKNTYAKLVRFYRIR